MRYVWTTAPESYDYSYMTTVDTYTAHGASWRLVQTEDVMRLENFQIPRYGSGLYPAHLASDFHPHHG